MTGPTDTDDAAGLMFRFADRWATIPDTPAGRISGRTHGVEVLPDGRVVVFCQAVPAVLFFNADGELTDSWGDRFIGAHGMTLTQHDGEPAFWLVDQASCEVVKTTITGQTIQRLDPPPVDARPDGKFIPTWADQDPQSGDVWVGDGYGGHALHRYDHDGNYYTALTELAGRRLNQPHGLRFAPNGTLWIGDRANHRLIVLDAAGDVLRESTDACHSPTSIAFVDRHAYVAELFGAVKILDLQLNVVAELFPHPRLVPAEGWQARDTWDWPTAAVEAGYPNAAGTEFYEPGRFCSPHGIAVCPNTGDVYVGEWMAGGRIIKLEKQ